MLKLFDKYGKAFRQLSNNELITEFRADALQFPGPLKSIYL